MEPFFPAIWSVFHDGTIDRVEGSVPGAITVYVHIEYLRKRFSDPGEHFVVTFPDCESFSFQPWDESVVIGDFTAIVDACPGIQSAEMDGDVCKVFTDTGLLKMKSADGSIRLDAGREISLNELLKTATAYWEAFEARSLDSK